MPVPKRGLPKKKNAAEAALAASREGSGLRRQIERKQDPIETPVYTCLRCGKSALKPEEHFYRIRTSTLYLSNDYYVPLCKTCLKNIYNEYVKKYDDVDIAFALCCAVLDIAYVPHVARNAIEEKPDSPIGLYLSRIAMTPHSELTYGDSYVKSLYETGDAKVAIREKQEKKWDDESLQNMQYIKNIVAYDPFEDESYTSADRKFLFNTMAGYCPDSTIASDSHKLQSILNIVKVQLQAHKVSELLSEELTKEPPDQRRIEGYTKTQKELYASINTMAKENGISAGSGAVKSITTLTERMRKLQEEDFEDIEFNLFSVEHSEALKACAQISAESIFKELQLDGADYTEIITKQRDLIEKLSKENSELSEDLRIYKNKEALLADQLANLKSKKKKVET